MSEMNDAPRPGEIDLESGQSAIEAGDPAPEPEPDPAPEPDPQPEPEPEPEPEPARKPTGAVAELLERRVENRMLRERLQQIEADPVLQRLTPEIRQALAEGRVVVAPPKTTADHERERLTETAQELGLLRPDGTPDLDAAARADRVIQRHVQRAIEPVVEQTRTVAQMTMREKAQANLAEAIRAAQANGYDETIIREEFEQALAAPNGAAMLAQPQVAMTIWKSALGRMVMEGKLTPAQAKAAAATAPTAAAAPITAPATGRRGASSAITLSPAMQAAYAAHGLDPATAFSATRGKPLDLSQGITLED